MFQVTIEENSCPEAVVVVEADSADEALASMILFYQEWDEEEQDIASC